MAAGITETDVWRAADALLLEGLRPTIERVRQKIGRGSPNTVSPYLETWFKSLGARIKDPGAFAAPTALPDPIHQASKHFWEVALVAAREELKEETDAARATLDEERDRLDALKTAMGAKEAAVEGQLRSQVHALELAERETRALRERVTQLEQILDRRDAELKQAQNDLAAARTEIANAASRREAEREQWLAERRELEVRHQATEQRWVLEVDRAREATKRTEAELVKERASSAALLAEARDHEKTLKAEGHAMHQREKAHLEEMGNLRHGLKSLEDEMARSREAHRQREQELLQRAAHAESRLAETLEKLTAKGSELAHLVRSFVEQNKRSNTNAPKRAHK